MGCKYNKLQNDNVILHDKNSLNLMFLFTFITFKPK